MLSAPGFEPTTFWLGILWHWAYQQFDWVESTSCRSRRVGFLPKKRASFLLFFLLMVGDVEKNIPADGASSRTLSTQENWPSVKPLATSYFSFFFFKNSRKCRVTVGHFVRLLHSMTLYFRMRHPPCFLTLYIVILFSFNLNRWTYTYFQELEKLFLL